MTPEKSAEIIVGRLATEGSNVKDKVGDRGRDARGTNCAKMFVTGDGLGLRV